MTSLLSHTSLLIFFSRKSELRGYEGDQRCRIFLTAIYRKSRGDLFIGGYKKGEQRVEREKEMMRELGG